MMKNPVKIFFFLTWTNKRTRRTTVLHQNTTDYAIRIFSPYQLAYEKTVNVEDATLSPFFPSLFTNTEEEGGRLVGWCGTRVYGVPSPLVKFRKLQIYRDKRPISWYVFQHNLNIMTFKSNNGVI